MSTKSLIPIQPIDFDIAKRAVDEFSQLREVPSSIAPSQLNPGTGEGATLVTAVQHRQPASPIKKLTLELPRYVVKELATRALKNDCTIKYIVLEALARNGISVKDTDLLQDGRRTFVSP